MCYQSRSKLFGCKIMNKIAYYMYQYSVINVVQHIRLNHEHSFLTAFYTLFLSFRSTLSRFNVKSFFIHLCINLCATALAALLLIRLNYFLSM